MMQRNVYLDSNASHPLLPNVRKSIAELMLSQEDLVNPSSIHRPGQKSKRVVTELREELCKILGRSDNDEFVLLSGATEAINLMMRSFVVEKNKIERKPVLFISRVEHSAVLDTARDLAENYGAGLEWIEVDSRGQISTPELVSRIQNIISASDLNDVLWVAQAANNETGVSFEFREILPKLHQEFGSKVLLDLPKIKNKYQKSAQRFWFAADCAQALGKLDDSDIRFILHHSDYAAFSAHKLGGPMGIGCLWHRPESPLRIQMTGGVQERRRRAGTHNILGIFGFLVALRDWNSCGDLWRKQMSDLRNYVADQFREIPGLVIHGSQADGSLPALCNTLNFRVEGCPEESLLLAMDLAGFAMSSGSACNSGSLKPSHVLKSMGLSTEQSLSALRFCLSAQSTKEEVDMFVKTLKEKIAQIRKAREQSKEFLE
jgi:cysteine desulfurase